MWEYHRDYSRRMIKPYYVPWSSLRNVLTNIKETYLWFRAFIQRGSRGYANRDVWSLYSYLLDIQIASLIRLRDKGISSPADLTEIEWKEILTTIIEGFKAGKEWSEEWLNSTDYRKKLFDRAQTLYTEYFFNLWD